MTLFPSPTSRCLLPSFPFHVRWKSLLLYSFEEKWSVWVTVDMKVFVAFFWLSHSLHLSWRLISLICVARARLEPSSMFIIRTGRCSFALPPLPTTSWDLLETFLTRMPFHGHCGGWWPLPHPYTQACSLFRSGIASEIHRCFFR